MSHRHGFSWDGLAHVFKFGCQVAGIVSSFVQVSQTLPLFAWLTTIFVGLIRAKHPLTKFTVVSTWFTCDFHGQRYLGDPNRSQLTQLGVSAEHNEPKQHDSARDETDLNLLDWTADLIQVAHDSHSRYLASLENMSPLHFHPMTWQGYNMHLQLYIQS